MIIVNVWELDGIFFWSLQNFTTTIARTGSVCSRFWDRGIYAEANLHLRYIIWLSKRLNEHHTILEQKHPPSQSLAQLRPVNASHWEAPHFRCGQNHHQQYSNHHDEKLLRKLFFFRRKRWCPAILSCTQANVNRSTTRPGILSFLLREDELETVSTWLDWRSSRTWCNRIWQETCWRQYPLSTTLFPFQMRLPSISRFPSIYHDPCVYLKQSGQYRSIMFKKKFNNG